MNRDREVLLIEIERYVEPSGAFVALTAASCAIATFGLLDNSVAVIIGAMLLAPLITPIVALTFALVSDRLRVFRQAAVLLVIGSTLSVGLSALLAALVNLPIPGTEILAGGHPNLLDLGVALAAGSIAGYARVRKGIAESVAGAAFAVALMPPLCVIGIGLALGSDWHLGRIFRLDYEARDHQGTL